jgi:hypothetical protein
MSDIPPWLPPLVRLDDFGGDWQRYLDALYEIFRRDFIEATPYFWDVPCYCKREDKHAGKERTFWHVISEGLAEEERLPDLRRCERIAWPRVLIQRISTADVLSWRSSRQKGERIVVSLPDFSYVVILDERKSHLILWTAYPVDHAHWRSKLRKEYERAQKS